MSLLEEQFKSLEEDLAANPVRISVYHDLPFALFVYNPSEEFNCRKLLRLFTIKMEQNHQKKVTFLSLGKLLWKISAETEGLEALIAQEKQLGFDRLQHTLFKLMSDEDFMPLYSLIAEQVQNLDPAVDIVFLVRTGALAPHFYRASMLLDQLHGKTMVPIILFYPGTSNGSTDIKFMNTRDHDSPGAYNYRVKIYHAAPEPLPKVLGGSVPFD